MTFVRCLYDPTKIANTIKNQRKIRLGNRYQLKVDNRNVGSNPFGCQKDRRGFMVNSGMDGDIPTAIEADLVLSSGFLAFANHAGFLAAIEDQNVRVSGIMGTSAGALTGSLFAAGYSPEEVLKETTRDAPYRLLRPNWMFWNGLFSLKAVVNRLKVLLPPTFEDLDMDFACAVITKKGEYKIIDSGPLPEAVAASAAIPLLFAPVQVPGWEDVGPFADGGKVERVGLHPWRKRVEALRNPSVYPQLALVHLIARSSPFSGNDKIDDNDQVRVLTSKKSGVSLLSLGDVQGQYDRSRMRSYEALDQLKRKRSKPKPVT